MKGLEMAKFLCRYRVVQYIFPPTPYQFRVTRNIALPNIPLSIPDKLSHTYCIGKILVSPQDPLYKQSWRVVAEGMASETCVHCVKRKSNCGVLHPRRCDEELQNGPCAPGLGCVLAGDPYSSSILPKEIREEVLRKWNQGPKPDIHKEWVKYAIYY